MKNYLKISILLISTFYLFSCRSTGQFCDELFINNVEINESDLIKKLKIVKIEMYFKSSKTQKKEFNHNLFNPFYIINSNDSSYVLVENQDKFLKYLFIKNNRIMNNVKFNPVIKKRLFKKGLNHLGEVYLNEDDLKINSYDSIVRFHYYNKKVLIYSNWFKIR